MALLLSLFPLTGKLMGGRQPIRNEQMPDYAEALIAISDGQSRGTKNMIDQARRRNLAVYGYTIGISLITTKFTFSIADYLCCGSSGTLTSRLTRRCGERLSVLSVEGHELKSI
ncbi:hypothetical protein BH20ACI3_BH20ACI3_02060 [soil metagenome]